MHDCHANILLWVGDDIEYPDLSLSKVDSSIVDDAYRVGAARLRGSGMPLSCVNVSEYHRTMRYLSVLHGIFIELIR